MYIQLKDLKFCIDKAREFSALYEAAHPNKGPQRSIDELHALCMKTLNAEINVWELDDIDSTASSITAVYQRFNDKLYGIWFANGLNYCHQRYVICKELFHVILDRPEYRNMKVDEHIEEVVTKFPVNDSKPGPEAICEIMAEISAMEFLFPFSERVKVLQEGKAIDFHVIALKFRIPQVYVERYLSASYMENLGALG